MIKILTGRERKAEHFKQRPWSLARPRKCGGEWQSGKR